MLLIAIIDGVKRWFILFQGTAAVVLAGLIAAFKLVEGTLAEHTFLFLGAGEVYFCYLISYLNQLVNSDKTQICLSGAMYCPGNFASLVKHRVHFFPLKSYTVPSLNVQGLSFFERKKDEPCIGWNLGDFSRVSEIITLFVYNHYKLLITGWHWNCRANCTWDVKAGTEPLTAICGILFFEQKLTCSFNIFICLIWVLFLRFQTNAPIEECRKRIWLVDSKVKNLWFLVSLF